VEYVSSHITITIRNQFPYLAVTHSASNVLDNCINIRWLSVLMTNYLIIRLLRTFQSTIRCSLHYPWVYKITHRLAKKLILLRNQRVQSDFVRFIPRRKSNSIVRMIGQCSALNVFSNIQRWSMMWFRYRLKSKRWKKWLKKWLLKLKSMTRAFQSTRTYTISWRWKSGKSSMRKLIS
jgi:hypothetical protein